MSDRIIALRSQTGTVKLKTATTGIGKSRCRSQMAISEIDFNPGHYAQRVTLLTDRQSKDQIQQ